MQHSRAEVHRLFNLGMRQSDVARALGISRQRVHQIIGQKLTVRPARYAAFLARNPDLSSEIERQMANIRTTVVDFLRTELILQRLTYADIAKRVGWKNASNAHRIITGNFRDIQLETLLKVAWSLGFAMHITFERP